MRRFLHTSPWLVKYIIARPSPIPAKYCLYWAYGHNIVFKELTWTANVAFCAFRQLHNERLRLWKARSDVTVRVWKRSGAGTMAPLHVQGNVMSRYFLSRCESVFGQLMPFNRYHSTPGKVIMLNARIGLWVPTRIELKRFSVSHRRISEIRRKP